MEEAQGDGWAEIQPDGSITGKSASTTATKPTSSRASGLLQQPARSELRMIVSRMTLSTPGEFIRITS